MASIKFVLCALASVIALANAAPEDGCTALTDCKGNAEVVIAADCTSSFGPDGRREALLSGLKGTVCLQCPGSGKVDLNTFPYFTCDGKPLCGTTKFAGTELNILPNQAKCIWQKPLEAASCIAGCTPNAPSPSTSGPTSAPSTGPTSAGPTSGKPTSGPSTGPTSSGPSTAPTSGPSSSTPTGLPSSPKPVVPTGSNDGSNCGPGELPVSVEGGQTGCAAVPICVGGFPNGNCPEGSVCGIVKTGVPGCKLGSGPTTGPTSRPSTGPTSGPSTGPTSGPSTGPTSGPSTGPTTSGPTSGPSTGPTTAKPTSGPSTGPTTAGPTTAKPTSGPTSGPTTSAPAPGVKCDPNTYQADCAGSIELTATNAGCAAAIKVLGQVGCVKCPGEFKKDAADPNQCYIYCGAKPQCGAITVPGIGALKLTPKQGLCALNNPENPIQCIG